MAALLMDDHLPLHKAVFQLTPTRTRFDLLAFLANGNADAYKIASGLLDPFLAHLGYLREQAPKGGYSIVLQPPGKGPTSWFTKSILQRFVQFVNTPDILERVVTIEREILHIDNSINSVEVPEDQGSRGFGDGNTNGFSCKFKGEHNGLDTAKGETSKYYLQRALGSRKAILQKEQGMAYARALVLGFDHTNIEALVSLADAFGAYRLREACLNFRDLCEKKENDKHWIDELARMEAFSQQVVSEHVTPGLILTAESVDHTVDEINLSSFSNVNRDGDTSMEKPPHAPFPWHYANGFQGSTKDGPYQPFAFPGMPLASPFFPGYPGYIHWPPSEADYGERASRYSDQQRNSKHPHAKEKSVHKKSHKSKSSKSQDDYQDDDYSNSEGGSDTDQEPSMPTETETSQTALSKRRSKKNSKTVVIRNINYVSSRRRYGASEESSDESSLDEPVIDGELLQDEVENVVTALQKHRRSRHQEKRKSRSKIGNTGTKSDANTRNVEAHPPEDNSEIENVNGSWQTVQSILMRDENSRFADPLQEETKGTARTGETNGSRTQIDLAGEYCIVGASDDRGLSAPICPVDDAPHSYPRCCLTEADPIITVDKDPDVLYKRLSDEFQGHENYLKSIKGTKYGEHDLLQTKFTDTTGVTESTLPDFSNESSRIRSHIDGGWSVVSKFIKETEVHTSAEDLSLYESSSNATVADHQQMKAYNENKVVLDDSFLFPTRNTVNEDSTSKWEADASIFSDILLTSTCGLKGQGYSTEFEESKNCEPDDLQIVLGVDSRLESEGISWTPDAEYVADLAYSKIDKKNPATETNHYASGEKQHTPEKGKNNKSIDSKSSLRLSQEKLLRGSVLSRSQVSTDNRKPAPVSGAARLKSKAEKEEESRRKAEELLAARQKRIAERSAQNTSVATSGAIRSKGAKTLTNHGTRSSHSSKQAMNKVNL